MKVRIDEEELISAVIDAYRETGCKPGYGSWGNAEVGCAMTALYVQHHPGEDFSADGLAGWARESVFGGDQDNLRSFTEGFDKGGAVPDGPYHRMGQRCRDAVQEYADSKRAHARARDQEKLKA